MFLQTEAITTCGIECRSKVERYYSSQGCTLTKAKKKMAMANFAHEGGSEFCIFWGEQNIF